MECFGDMLVGGPTRRCSWGGSGHHPSMDLEGIDLHVFLVTQHTVFMVLQLNDVICNLYLNVYIHVYACIYIYIYTYICIDVYVYVSVMTQFSRHMKGYEATSSTIEYGFVSDSKWITWYRFLSWDASSWHTTRFQMHRV